VAPQLLVANYYRTLCKMILSTVLYGSLTSSFEHSVSENGELKRIFGPNMEEVTGQWRNPAKLEFHNLYYSQTILVG
jgi:hypothetical protein